MAGSEVNAGDERTPRAAPVRAGRPAPTARRSSRTPTACSELARRNLWMHFTRMGSYDEHHSVPVIVQGRGLLRLRRARQALPRRPLRALLRQRGPRPRRDRRRRRPRRPSSSASTRTGATRTRRRSSSPRASPGSRPGNLNRVFFTSGGSEAVESAWKLAKAYHRARGEMNRYKLVSRNLAYHGVSMGALDGDRAAAAARAVRAADARRRARAEHELLPLERGPRPAVGRRRDRGGDRIRGPRHGRGGDPRAGPERRRLLHAAGRLLPARARDLRPPRRAADLRRGDLLVGPARALVRLRTLRLPAGHDHDRQGHQLRLRAARRGDRGRPHRRAVPARHGVLRPRLHLRRAPRRLRGRAREHRSARARGPAGQRARERGRSSGRCSTGCATCRSSATCAAPATSTRSSWSRTKRPRRPSTTTNRRSCCAASSPASSTGAG